MPGGVPYSKRDELFAEDIEAMFKECKQEIDDLRARVQDLEDLNRDGIVDEKDRQIRDAILAFVQKDNPQVAAVLKLADGKSGGD